MNASNLKIWAIINLTPDSFYPASRVELSNFVQRCVQSLAEGADVLDIGAESTRPYSESISADEEWSRLNQPLSDLKKEIGEGEFFRRISIDTYKAETARKVLELGVGYINDVRGGENPELLKAVSEHNAGIVLMHSKGNPKEMQVKPEYDDVVQDVLQFLQTRSEAAHQCGISAKNIIWDCGIGFGKNLDHNLQLLNHADTFRNLMKPEYRLLYGISRKSFIDKLLNIPDVEMRRDPTMIIHTILAMHNVDILRVHDVKETVMIRNLLKRLK